MANLNSWDDYIPNIWAAEVIWYKTQLTGCSYLVLQPNYDVLDKLGYATRLYNTILHLTSFNQIKAAAHMEK